MITQKYLKEILIYDKETGDFFWRKKMGKMLPLTKAGTVNVVHKYVCIGINGKKYRAHRLAWIYETGEHPKQEIDHINGIRWDNRFCNLRDVSPGQNQQNRTKANRNNSQKLLGAYRQNNKFISVICVNRKQIYLGVFNTPIDAHNAYLEAKRNLHKTCSI